ncbi:MAG: PAS domain S-box protein [Proteobacteria bacterium]|nr:PAS domain S-box protein [Pseudomonadota bacterium]
MARQDKDFKEYVSRRFNDIAQAMKSIMNGDFDHEIPIEDHEGEYEALVETMAMCFNMMINNIKKNVEKNKQLNSEAEIVNKALIQSEQKYKMLFEGTSEGILVADSETMELKYANPAFCNMLGYSEKELIGKHVTDIHPEENSELVISKFNSPTREEKSLIKEIPCLRKDKELVSADITVSLIELEGDPCSIAFFTDVTKRRSIEDQLIQAQKFESIGRLTVGIVHEIDTPAKYVSNNTKFLKESFGDLTNVYRKYEDLKKAVEDGRDSAEIVECIENALEETDVEYLLENIPNVTNQFLEAINGILNMLQAIKEFSHSGTGKKMYLDINKTLETTIVLCRNEWKNIANIETEFFPNMPPVLCLPGDLTQAFLNIIVNAAHAVDEVQKEKADQTKGAITITTRKTDDFAEIRVEDTGSGIPENIGDRVFEPFFTTKNMGKGTGQGLSIARSAIVDKHKGRLFFETKEDRGTTFVIQLPLKTDKFIES